MATRFRSFEDELSQSGLLIESTAEPDSLEPGHVNFVDHRGLRTEQVATDRDMIGPTQGHMEMETRFAS
jgi:hypothetical protein